MRTLKRTAAIHREFTTSERIPYTAHVAPTVVKTVFGDYLQAFRLGGASFESSDDEELNNWHERLNVLWRNIASPSVALWTHVIRRRAPVGGLPAGSPRFADSLHARYRQKLGSETLMLNEIYLSVLYRPVAGAASGWL